MAGGEDLANDSRLSRDRLADDEEDRPRREPIELCEHGRGTLRMRAVVEREDDPGQIRETDPHAEDAGRPGRVGGGGRCPPGGSDDHSPRRCDASQPACLPRARVAPAPAKSPLTESGVSPPRSIRPIVRSSARLPARPGPSFTTVIAPGLGSDADAAVMVASARTGRPPA